MAAKQKKNRKYDRNRKSQGNAAYKSSNRMQTNKARKIAKDKKLKAKAVAKWEKRTQKRKPQRGDARKARRANGE